LFQAGRIEGRKEALCSQAFSNRKILDRGIVVDIESIRGVWSEVGLGREYNVESGNFWQCSMLAKARSNLARIGSGCWLDQVKRLSERGNSETAIARIASLKEDARALLKLLLFLSSLERRRLKSPMRIQGPEMEEAISINSERKSSV
jgi:hypothetical protein